ncbi:endoribonuclease Dicer-like [Heracleum sosnowskyi]|uniref:Endoribonuclease Dicer-like n=1 Tax=Heracleum sosnowskyi TaxID=360622 RepID=A0AAD8NAS2_9APIA|nr:endoribonuclease Dicer-like [Heracleum sosnowskyi]
MYLCIFKVDSSQNKESVVDMPLVQTAQQLSADHLPFARSYQLDAFEMAMKQNTIVFLETGSGKTLISIMLLRSYAHCLRKPSSFLAVFLVPTVVLVSQQAEVIETHTDLKVGKYWGEMGVDFWNAADWKKQQDEFEVLVMTPQILLNSLRHSFIKLETIRVLIFDECHHARGRHPYACIMTEFYHPQVESSNLQLPRILGMTASLINTKGSSDKTGYWKKIHELENLMNSKVFTCSSESVITEHLAMSTPKLKSYRHMDIPYSLVSKIASELNTLKEKFERDIEKANIEKPQKDNTRLRLSKLCSTFFFCLEELGLWLAMKAADTSSSKASEMFIWDKLDKCGERILTDFSSDAFKVFSGYMPSDPDWSISDDMRANVANGYLSTKVICLFESLLERRGLKDLRCIVFVERVITAIVLCRLLNVLLPSLSGWKTEYMTGSNTRLQLQTRKAQNNIVEEFRKGMVNIIVATSVLEEGLDVQSCNLVVRFDPSATVCSFIQSRGRARMQNSEFLLLVKSGDNSSLARVDNYLSSGKVMRQESLRHAAVPCQPLDTEIYNEVFYRVDSTGAIVTLSSSVSLIYFYCSRLPSDGYFKPFPRCEIDKELQKCILDFPKSCPLPSVTVHGSVKTLKQLACLEACKTLHRMGALTDNLVPDMMEEEDAEEMGHVEHVNEHDIYVPSELVGQGLNNAAKTYYCYMLELDRSFSYDIPMDHLLLAASSELNFGEDNIAFGLEFDRGSLTVRIKYSESISLTSEQVLMCQQFQVKLFRVLNNNDYNKLKETIDAFHPWNDHTVYDYLLLPTTGSQQSPTIDWRCVRSILYETGNICHDCPLPEDQYNIVQTRNGLVCRCVLENSLVCTPHNGYIYCIVGTIDGMNGSSVLNLKDGESITYKNYYEKRHGIDLQFEREHFLKGRHIFPVQNHLHKYKKRKEQERSNGYVELPPELCSIVMSPISVGTCYTFSFAPAIMHRIESLLIASSLKNMHADYCNQNVIATTKIPTIKVLEAITTKKCQEKFDLESLEALGDSFLKYAACQQVFKIHQDKHEGILSIKKNKIISNSNLCKLGCSRKLQGLIRNEPFDPKMWIIPGDHMEAFHEVQLCTATKVFTRGIRKIKSKVIADVVEALIGVYLSCGGEVAALSVMTWLGVEVNFLNIPYKRSFPAHPEKLINLSSLESILKYSFKDASLLVEALTHGSFMLPQVPQCYQRLEFLGDSVLDYLVTMHLYNRYPGMSPGLLTDLRSASVNNDCYSLSAVKVGLQKHILHASEKLQEHIDSSVQNLDPLLMGSTFGWESENSLPKVLGDVIESIAGAILVDSGYKKDIVFKSILPLLEPLVSPETLKLQPVRELHQLCQKENYVLKKPVVTCENGVSAVTVEVEANGIIYKESCTALNKAEAKKLASKAVLKLLKESMSMEPHPTPFLSSPKGKKRKEEEGESHGNFIPSVL